MNNNKLYLKQLLTIAVPIMLGNIISQLQMLIDRAFLGHVDVLYMSALGNVTSPVWTTMSVNFSIVVGASIIISQKVGAKDTAECELYSASLLKWIHVLPVALMLFWIFCGKFVFIKMGVSETVLPMCMEYMYFFVPNFLIIGIEASTMVIMQTSNYTKPMVYFGIIRSLLNVFLDWVMIFGHLGCPAMGIKGAAIATTIAEYAGVLASIWIFIKSDKLFTRPRLKALLAASPIPFLRSAKLGINTALEDFLWNIGNLALIAILNSINEKAAGIYSMIFGIEILVVVVVGSIGNATLTLTGEATGAHDSEKFKNVCKVAYYMSFACAVIMLVMCIIMPKVIIGFFTTDENIIATSGFYLILMCLNLYSKFGNIIVGNGIRGSGDTRWMFLTQIFGTCCVVLCALLFVKVLNFGIKGVFFAVMTDEFLRIIINFFKIRKVVIDMPAKTAE